MNSLVVREFKGAQTVSSNNTSGTNLFFVSKIKDIECKLSKSYYSLKLPISGTENYVINKKTFQVDEESFLVTNSNQDILAHLKSHKVVHGVCIGFTEDFMLNLAGSLSQKLVNGLDNPYDVKRPIYFFTKKNMLRNSKLDVILNRIKNDVLNHRIEGRNEQDMFYLNLGELLLEHQLKVHSDINRLPQAKYSTRKEIYYRVSLLNDYIHANYKENITLDKLSEISFLSKFHAIRCYQAIFNRSPYQKIQMLRLETAKQLIKTGMPIKDVAKEVNFLDHRALSKQFKKHFNMTPTEFSANHI